MYDVDTNINYVFKKFLVSLLNSAFRYNKVYSETVCQLQKEFPWENVFQAKQFTKPLQITLLFKYEAKAAGIHLHKLLTVI